MEYADDKSAGFSYLLTHKGIITEVGEAFAEFAGYTNGDLKGKSITEVWAILKIYSLSASSDIRTDYDYYLFTKSYETKKVSISYKTLNSKDESIYSFIEKRTSFFEGGFLYLEQLCYSNVVGVAIYSSPDIILLKANQAYLNFLDEPYNKMESSIGKRQWEILPGFHESGLDKIWENVTQSGEPFHTQEYRYEFFKRGVTYWDSTMVSIVNNGKVDYSIITIVDVTEKVLNRKRLEEQSRVIAEQKKILEAIIDNSDDNIVMIDKVGSYIKRSESSDGIFEGLSNIKEFYNSAEFYNADGTRLRLQDLPSSHAINGQTTKSRRLKFIKNGTERYYDISSTPIFDENGNFILGVSRSHEVTDHVIQSKVIELQNKELAAVIESIDEFITIINKDGIYTKVNKNIDKIFSPIHNSRISDYYGQVKFCEIDGTEIPLEEMTASKVKRGERVKHRKLIVKKDGKDIYIDISGIPILDENGDFFMGVIITYDITELIEKTKIIEQQNKQIETILENMSDALFFVDRDGKYIKLNKAAKMMYPQEDIKNVGDNYSVTKVYDINGKEVEFGKIPGYRMLNGEKLINEMLLVETGGKQSYLSVSATPILDDSGNFMMGVICSRDITKRIEYENTLKKQYDTLYSIIDNLDLPILRLSYPDFNVIEINQKACRYLTELSKVNILSSECIIGKSILEFFPQFKSGHNYNRICEMVENKKSVHLKDLRTVVNGNESYINLFYQPILGVDGRITEFLIASSDVTYEIHQKQEIEKVMKIQEEFFSFIAHEFRTPLTTINSTIQFMELVCWGEMNEEIKKYVNMIKRSTFQQMRLVNNLLDISRAESGYLKVNKRNFDIVAMTKAISNSINSFAKAKDIDIKFSSQLSEKNIAVDDEKYERILLNLLSNAIKFTPNGRCIYITLSENHNKVAIQVKDEGIGIPEDKYNKIFERFGQTGSSLTRESEGTGIGLYLVKLLAKAMGGDIKVESTEGSGSTFTFSLPARKAAHDEKIVPPEFTNNRLVRALNIEFSNIYLD